MITFKNRIKRVPNVLTVGELTNGVAPGGVAGRQLVREGAVVAEGGACGAQQHAVVHPVVEPHADAQRLAFTRTRVGPVLDQHRQAAGRAAHLQASAGITLGVPLVLSAQVPAELLTERTEVGDLHGAAEHRQLVRGHVWDRLERQLLLVLLQVADGHGELVLSAELAALHHKVAAQPAAPVQPLGPAVVGPVPPAVLQQGQSQAGEHPVLGVGTRHRLVLKGGGGGGGGGVQTQEDQEHLSSWSSWFTSRSLFSQWLSSVPVPPWFSSSMPSRMGQLKCLLASS
ncbi:hypothetical protein EYF80_020243 [Liparis tanakae]|uniref:Uncharacterized protein n=1 Tax=Liparis tanakae TaxID=230148 RepID=A0A4Z2HVA5_9TELE|nr:hypothetical protein EYF80_020243 [Liparis tanakae]